MGGTYPGDELDDMTTTRGQRTVHTSSHGMASVRLLDV